MDKNVLSTDLIRFLSLSISFYVTTCRYYRANSVRYPNGPCEGMCAHNHFCAITRVDYDEYRHCRESAASALASAGAQSRAPLPLLAHLSVLLAAYAIMSRQPRQLLFGWLQCARLMVRATAVYVNAAIWTIAELLCKWLNAPHGHHWTWRNARPYDASPFSTSTPVWTPSSSSNHANHLINISINHKSNFPHFMCTQFWSNFIACVTLIRYYCTFRCHTIRFYRMPNVVINGRHADNDNDDGNDCDYVPIGYDSSDIQSSNLSNNSIAEYNYNNAEKRTICQNTSRYLGSLNQIAESQRHLPSSNVRLIADETNSV